MPLLDEAQTRRAQFTADAIKVSLTTSPLTTKAHLPPGVYSLYCSAAAHFVQGASGVSLGSAAGTPTVTPQGTPGSTTYGYKVVAKFARPVSGVHSDGFAHSAAGSEGQTTTGNATLDETNFNRVSWTAVPGASAYDVYRVTGGATQGKIGSVTAPTVQIDDTGLAASGSAPTEATGDGNPLPALTMVGPVLVDEEARAYFDAKADTGTATLELVPLTE